MGKLENAIPSVYISNTSYKGFLKEFQNFRGAVVLIVKVDTKDRKKVDKNR